jgi:anti-sigma B factor antagonist
VLFDVQCREQEGWSVLAIVGELDLAAVPRVRQLALQAVLGDRDRPRVIVDLSSVDFLDSAGLGVVLGIVRRVRQAEGQVAVVLDPASPVGRVFSLLDLDRVVPVATDVSGVIERERTGAFTAERAGGHDG